MRGAAVFKMLGQEREAEQQGQQIGQPHPFVPGMRRQTTPARAFVEWRTHGLVERNAQRAGQRGPPGQARHGGDHTQHGSKENEFERNARHCKTGRRW